MMAPCVLDSPIWENTFLNELATEPFNSSQKLLNGPDSSWLNLFNCANLPKNGDVFGNYEHSINHALACL